MKILSTEGQTSINSEAVHLVQLVRFGFAEPLCLNSSNWDFEFEGEIYKGAYGLGNLSEVEDSPGEVKGLSFQLAGGSADLVALALDDAKVWQGTPVVLRLAVLNSEYQIVDAPITWSGSGDTMNIQEEDEKTDIQATAESSAVDLMRSHVLTYNNADQQMLFPGDLGLQYIVSQVDRPVVWPTKEWFFK
jgi:hypothetical protein